MRFLIFFSVALLVFGGAHAYIWLRLVRDTAAPQPWRLMATIAVVLLALLVPASFILRRGAGTMIASLYWPAMIWMGLVLLLVLLLGAIDTVKLIWFIAAKLRGAPPVDPARRLFLSRVAASAAGAMAAAAGAWGVRSALRAPKVEEVRVPLARLPRSLDGTKIVQLTDLHVGPTIGHEFVAEVVERANALEPDVVAITGDLVDGSVAALRESVAPLAGLKARHGVYFVTGNHEYYSGAIAWEKELGRLGVRVLRNERVTIGEGADSFDLAGVDDYNAYGMAPGHGADLEKALVGRDPSRELVLLAHQPRAIHEAARLGVGLQLSGHTHGGQIWPWKYMVYLQQPFVAGLARLRDTWIYTSRGTGYWGPPMRLATPSEITKIVLRAG